MLPMLHCYIANQHARYTATLLNCYPALHCYIVTQHAPPAALRPLLVTPCRPILKPTQFENTDSGLSWKFMFISLPPLNHNPNTAKYNSKLLHWVWIFFLIPHFNAAPVWQRGFQRGVVNLSLLSFELSPKFNWAGEGEQLGQMRSQWTQINENEKSKLGECDPCVIEGWLTAVAVVTSIYRLLSQNHVLSI